MPHDKVSVLVHKLCSIVAFICNDWFFSQYGYTALHVAALKGHSDVMKLLLAAGAIKNIPDKVDKLIHQLEGIMSRVHDN